MNYNYSALIQGGIGPDVWDKELNISAVDFIDAAKQATGAAEELHGHVVELLQNDWNVQIDGQAKEELAEVKSVAISLNDALSQTEHHLSQWQECARDFERRLREIAEAYANNEPFSAAWAKEALQLSLFSQLNQEKK